MRYWASHYNEVLRKYFNLLKKNGKQRIKYLGVKFSSNIGSMIKDNIGPAMDKCF